MNPSHQRVAIITGVSSGIGLACASKLAQQGIRIYGLSRRAPEATISNLTYIRTDVTDDASVASAVRTVLLHESRIDILINNAGFGIAGAIEDTSVEEAKRQLDVNLLGALRLTTAVLPTMRAQQSGYILNISSIGGLIAIPFQGLYSASKFALEGLTESLRLEVRSLGVRVVLIEPGDHRSAFTENRAFTEASSANPAIELTSTEPLAGWPRTNRMAPPPTASRNSSSESSIRQILVCATRRARLPAPCLLAQAPLPICRHRNDPEDLLRPCK